MLYNLCYYSITFFVMFITIKYAIIYFPKDFIVGTILIAYFIELLINIYYHYELEKNLRK